MDSKQSVSAGIPIGWLTMIVLIILKATGNLAMGWFWVITSFIWAPLALVAISFAIITLALIVFGGPQ